MIAALTYQPNYAVEMAAARRRACIAVERAADDRPEVFGVLLVRGRVVWISLKTYGLISSAMPSRDHQHGQLVLRIDDRPRIVIGTFSGKGGVLTLGITGLDHGRHRFLYYFETAAGVPSYGQLCT